MPNLSPWNIFYPDQTTGLTPLASKFAQLAQSVSDALTLVNAGTIPPVANQAARDALFPSGVRKMGSRVRRLDLGYDEQYYTAYDPDTNYGGATPAGWYPVSGAGIAAELVRGHDDTWTATTITPVWQATFIGFPAGTYRVTAIVNWGADTQQAGSLVFRSGTVVNTNILIAVGSDIATNATRTNVALDHFYDHSGGNLSLGVDILATGTGNKQIYSGTRFLIEYVAPLRGGIVG